MVQIFLSYAHADRHIKSELVEHFEAVDVQHDIQLWHDDKLRAGEAFDPAIEAALTKSQFCILLLSRKFLISKYIMSREYALVRRLEEANRITVFAVKAGPFSAYADPSITARSQKFYALSLGDMPHPERDRELSKFVDEVIRECASLRAERSTNHKLRTPPPMPVPQSSNNATNIETIVVDARAARLLLRAGIDEDWFQTFDPIPDPGIRTTTISGTRFFLTPGGEELPDGVIAFDVGSDAGLFNDLAMSPVLFRRALQVALSRWLDSISIPSSWKPFHGRDGSLISIYPASIKRSRFSRLHVSFFDGDPKIAYVHHLSSKVINTNSVPMRQGKLDEGMDRLLDAVLESRRPPATRNPELSGVISLDLPIGGAFSTHFSFDEWYAQLTSKQRKFVDTPINGPIRLKGPAGTGKTLALVIKMMREARLRHGAKENWRALFLTHSQSTVSYVWSLLDSIDKDEMISIDDTSSVTLRFHTIYDLASERTLPANSDVEPLSTDGREGRETQKQILSEVIDELLENGEAYSSWTKGVSGHLKSELDQASGNPNADIIFELINEFASKITGEGLDYKSDEDLQRYLGENRLHRWLMPLPNAADRRLVWRLYRGYCDKLSQKGFLSLDQIVADLNSDLQKNEYRMRRAREGFDAIFVDEAHLFSQIERDTLPRLLRNPPENYANGPPIILAHDLKQSPDNRFAQLYDREHSRRWVAASAQNAETHEFDEVYRFTPQISALVEAIDRAFPQFMIADDWAHYTGKSQLTDGPKPTVSRFATLDELSISVAKSAAKAAASQKSSRVAVLCVDERRFERIASRMLDAVPSAVTIIDERGDQSLMQTARNRFVFSRPDYVAGLQFDTVFVVGADRDVEMRGEVGEQRIYLSNLYTAVTRAERMVHLAVCDEAGGSPHVLQRALEEKIVELLEA